MIMLHLPVVRWFKCRTFTLNINTKLFISETVLLSQMLYSTRIKEHHLVFFLGNYLNSNFIRFDKIIRSGLTIANDICFFFLRIRYNLGFLSLFIYILYKWACINYNSQVFEWNSNEFLHPLNNIRFLAFNLGGAYVVGCWRVFHKNSYLFIIYVCAVFD